MPEVVNNRIKLFADDSKLIGIIKNIKDRDFLQNDIDSVVKWSNDWFMTFNKDKCEFMEIYDGKSKTITDIINSSNGFSMKDSNGERHILKKTQIERDLGINISHNLKSAAHIQILTSLGLLKVLFRNVSERSKKEHMAFRYSIIKI